MALPPGLRPEKVFKDGESPSRAHPAGRDGYNSLHLQGSRLDFSAGLSAPLSIEPVSGRNPWLRYSSSSLFSSSVVTGTGHRGLFSIHLGGIRSWSRPAMKYF